LSMYLAIVASATIGWAGDGGGGSTTGARIFPRPVQMERQIGFWRNIFTRYSMHEIVLHDAVRVDKVYKVVDARRYLEDGMTDGQVERLGRIESDLELESIRTTLLRLHELGPNPQGLTGE